MYKLQIIRGTSQIYQASHSQINVIGGMAKVSPRVEPIFFCEEVRSQLQNESVCNEPSLCGDDYKELVLSDDDLRV